jgi:hypothetical protein
MKNETTLPVYETLEALLAAEVPQADATETASDFPSWGAAMGEWGLLTAEVPALRAHCQALASELADKPLTVDQALALVGF